MSDTVCIPVPKRPAPHQIYDEARKFTFQTGIRPVVVYGGAPVVNQVRGLVEVLGLVGGMELLGGMGPGDEVGTWDTGNDAVR